MRHRLLLLSLVLSGTASGTALTGSVAFAQAPPATQQKPAAPAAAPAAQKPPATPPATGTQKPAPAPQTRKPAPAASGRAGMAITVTDMRGMTIPGVHVEVAGPTNRMGETNDSGQINFPGLTAGTYRLRFSGDPVTTFEREVTIRAGQIADLDIALSAAPPRPEAPPPPKPEPPPAPAAVVGPRGEPQLTSLYDLAEKELRARQPRQQILIACSGNTRSTMVFIATEQPQRNYEEAEVSYYVLGGEGTFRVGGKEMALAAGGYVAIPRGTPFSIVKRGRNTLSLLSVLSGSPCEEAR